ncbi:MAG: Short-chain dehydrogenase of various substrate specificity [Clostridiales bacterium]|jgi:short-subunit dehydrogenase|nr:Short-chain dehydrogenase of various substrate specificity [Clostridiales bacterium]
MSNIAIITGASSGFGKEFTKQLASKYRKLDEIWVIARRTELLETLAKEVTSTKIKVLSYDITNREHILELKKLLAEKQPTVRILVNNAGYGLMGHFDEIPLESQLGMINLNCYALTEITHFVLPYMKQRSQIIQIASSAAFIPQPSFAIYAASKSYVYSFSRALAQELKPYDISVTVVCPGPASTEFFDIASTTGDIKLIKNMFMANPVNVVKEAIEDAAKGKQVSTHTLAMKSLRILARIVPTRFILPFMK